MIYDVWCMMYDEDDRMYVSGALGLSIYPKISNKQKQVSRMISRLPTRVYAHESWLANAVVTYAIKVTKKSFFDKISQYFYLVLPVMWISLTSSPISVPIIESQRWDVSFKLFGHSQTHAKQCCWFLLQERDRFWDKKWAVLILPG